MSEWRYIAEYPATCRLEVPGGWIYRVPSDSGAALFVPDPEQAKSKQHYYAMGYRDANLVAGMQQGDKVKPAAEHTQYQVGYEEGYAEAKHIFHNEEGDKVKPLAEVIAILQGVLDSDIVYGANDIQRAITLLEGK